MSSRWRWLSALDSWDTPSERYGASWDKYIVLSFKGDTDCWLLGTSKKQPRSSNYYKEITCVEFYFSSFVRWMPDLKLQLFIRLADVLLRSFPLPVAIPLAAHNFTGFFKGGKEVKVHHRAALSLFFPASYCTNISTQVFTNHFIFSSSLILFQICSLSIIAVLFSSFSAITTFCF